MTTRKIRKTRQGWPATGDSAQRQRTPRPFREDGPLVCNGVACAFASEARGELAAAAIAIHNLKDRIGMFENYLNRIAGMVQNTHRDTIDIRRTLRVVHGMGCHTDDDGECEEDMQTTPEETGRWLGRTPPFGSGRDP